jgi:hypothetical protein
MVERLFGACALLLFLTIVGLPGCSSNDDEELSLPPFDTEAPHQILFQPSQMSQGAEWAESALLPAQQGATRIGMLIDLAVPLSNVGSHIEVRGFDSEGKPLDWASVEVTFSEEYYLVARWDPGTVLYAAQLRVPTTMIDDIAYVRLATVLPEPPGQESENASDSSREFAIPYSMWDPCGPAACLELTGNEQCCANGGECTYDWDGPQFPGISCTCAAGYEGATCETDIDECKPAPCLNGGECTDAVNGFVCACAAGFEGTTCETDIDECGPVPCLNGGYCTDAVNGFVCACAAGFEGTTCETNIDDCTPAPCVNGGECSDAVDDFSCACPDGFGGKTCEINADDCTPNPCVNGSCTDGVAGFSCACAAGWEGALCELNVDDCAPQPCLNAGECLDEVNGFSCACAAGYEGATCETDIDECGPAPCLNGGECTDAVNGFVCACATGYEGTTCETDIDECGPAPCLNGGACTDAVNGFVCACATGYEGTTCETNTDDCSPDPCVNGSCTDGVADFDCACDAGWEGALCEINADDGTPDPRIPSVSDVVLTRSNWKARPTKCTLDDLNKVKMAIHHTETPQKSGGTYEGRLRQIQAYHMDIQNYCDVGYHYLVTDDGRVWEGRPIAKLGAHVYEHNTGNIGISFVGCYHSSGCDGFGSTSPPKASLSAAANLIDALAKTYGIAKTPAKVKGHGEHQGANTTCPGDNLLSRIPELLSQIPWWELAGGYASAQDAIDAGIEPPAGWKPEPVEE